MHLGQVALNGRGVKVGFESRQIDLQRFTGPHEHCIPLKTIQPHGGMGVDVLEGARNHLQTDIIDLVIGQPLHEDPPGLQHALAQCIKLLSVQVAIAGVLGIKGIDRHHIVRVGCDQEVIPPIVDGHMQTWVRENVVVHLGKEAGRAHHAGHELNDIEPL